MNPKRQDLPTEAPEIAAKVRGGKPVRIIGLGTLKWQAPSSYRLLLTNSCSKAEVDLGTKGSCACSEELLDSTKLLAQALEQPIELWFFPRPQSIHAGAGAYDAKRVATVSHL